MIKNNKNNKNNNKNINSNKDKKGIADTNKNCKMSEVDNDLQIEKMNEDEDFIGSKSNNDSSSIQKNPKMSKNSEFEDRFKDLYKQRFNKTFNLKKDKIERNESKDDINVI